MSNEQAQTPPETCPVCNWGVEGTDTDDGRIAQVFYMCGAMWVSYRHGQTEWLRPCGHAMTAALRCGATLEPTPLEQARAALVEAAVRERGVWQTLNAALEADFDTTWQLAQAHHAASEAFDTAVAAYRALLEPRP